MTACGRCHGRRVIGRWTEDGGWIEVPCGACEGRGEAPPSGTVEDVLAALRGGHATARELEARLGLRPDLYVALIELLRARRVRHVTPGGVVAYALTEGGSA